MVIKTTTIQSDENIVKRIYISRGEGKRGSRGIKAGKRLGLQINKLIYWLDLEFTYPSELNRLLRKLRIQILDNGTWGFYDQTGQLIISKKAVKIGELHERLFSEESAFFKRSKLNSSKDIFWSMSSLSAHLTQISQISGQELQRVFVEAIKKGLNRNRRLSCEDENGIYGSGIYFTIPLDDDFQLDVVIKAEMDRQGDSPNDEGGYDRNYVMQVAGLDKLFVRHPAWYKADEIMVSDMIGLEAVNRYIKEVFDGFRYCQEHNSYRDMTDEHYAFRRKEVAH